MADVVRLPVMAAEMRTAAEGAFAAGVWRAYLDNRHRIGSRTVLIACPLCADLLDVVERSERMTFCGPASACIQYCCERCGLSGERDL